MIKLYFKNYKSISSFIYIISIIVFFYQTIDKPIIETIMYTHYLTLCTNTLFLYINYKRYLKLIEERDMILVRVSQDTLVNKCLGISILNIALYMVSVYLPYIIIIIYNDFLTSDFICFICLTIFEFALFECLYVFSILCSNKKVRMLFMLLPIILNVTIHYIGIPIIFG